MGLVRLREVDMVENVEEVDFAPVKVSNPHKPFNVTTKSTMERTAGFGSL